MSHENTFNRVLLVREPWLSLILSGEKTWEMRKMKTHLRGYFGLSQPGSGVISGVASLIDVKEPLSASQLLDTFMYHHVPPGSQFSTYNIPWILSNAQRFTTPLPFMQPPGAVVWVKVNKHGVFTQR